MHNERHAARLDAGIETCRSDFEYIGLQFGGSHIDHADKALQIPDFWESGEKYPPGFTILNSHNHWTPLQKAHYIYHESKHHDFFDGISSKRSHTWPGDHPDFGCGSSFDESTTPSISVLGCLESRTEYSWPPDDHPLYTSGVAKPRQLRTKTREDKKLRCNICQWVGKTPSEKRKHDARHRKDHQCKEDGCEARFGTRNDLERHRKSVHGRNPQCGPTESYKCFGRNCGHPEKVWPRLDNFKAHIKLKHNEQNEEDLLSQSRAWYKKQKKEEEEEEEEEEVKKLSNLEAVYQLSSSSIDIAPRKEPPTTPTITPSKTWIDSSNHNTSDYFDDKLEKLTLNPIGRLQSLSVNVLPENLQTLSELPYSPLKEETSLANHGDWKIPSVRDILGDVTSLRHDDSVNRRMSGSTPSKGTLPGVESFDHVVPSTKVLDVVAGMRELSPEERNFCLKIASNWKAKTTQNTPRSEEDHSAKTCVETLGKDYEMAREGPKQEGFGCPLCFKSFNRLSTLKKHRKRHDKPYGCTFTGCYGRFGSKADWKRHESMQHGHTQSFRCSLPRGNHLQCAKLFLHKNDFREHLDTFHQADHEKILHQIATGHIGPKDEESRFSYWCGFCKEIKTVEKTGVDALNERFDHIDLHFQKNENIKRWVPAKGHTEKGAQKRRDKNRKKESKRTATSRREDDSGVLYDNGYNDGDYSTYEECPSSADEACIEDKSHPDSYGESKKSRKLEQDETGEVSVYCCRCNGLLPIMALRCVECEHDSCSLCKREKRGPDRLL